MMNRSPADHEARIVASLRSLDPDATHEIHRSTGAWCLSMRVHGHTLRLFRPFDHDDDDIMLARFARWAARHVWSVRAGVETLNESFAECLPVGGISVNAVRKPLRCTPTDIDTSVRHFRTATKRLLLSPEDLSVTWDTQTNRWCSVRLRLPSGSIAVKTMAAFDDRTLNITLLARWLQFRSIDHEYGAENADLAKVFAAYVQPSTENP